MEKVRELFKKRRQGDKFTYDNELANKTADNSSCLV